MALPRKWVIIIPILAGVATIAMLKQNKLPPVQEPLQEQAKLVRTIKTPSLTVAPNTRGHGTVQPSRTWEAVAQVKGKIVEKHPQLEKGAILPRGTLILRIDPTDYELAIAQAEADIQATQAQIQEQEARANNTRASLKIEQAALALNENELQRKRALIGKGSVSHSDLESQERSLLAQQQSVQSQKNTLNLLPSQRAQLDAQLARHQSTLASARRNLANTEVRLPFTSRISEVSVEQDQYIREGEVLAMADDLQKAEIETQIPIDQMNGVLHAGRDNSGEMIDLLNRAGNTTPPPLGLSASIHLQEGSLVASWDARFARFSDTLDPKTRTVGVIVEVDEPYARVQPGIRPPLLKGLFVEVSLTGEPRPNSLVIPRSALHGDRVHVANGDRRLEIREVKVGLLQPEFAVIEQGLQAGEEVVVSDLVPAIDGMLLKTLPDEASLQHLTRQALGSVEQ
jgi:multidrug efflux system membrane fusion protein